MGSTEINHSFSELHFAYHLKLLTAIFQSLSSFCSYLWSSSSVTEVSLQFLFSTRQKAIAVTTFMLFHQYPFLCVTNIPDPLTTFSEAGPILPASRTHT